MNLERIDPDVDLVARQMHAEADRIAADHATRACYWCGTTEVGLCWLPSEVGVIEMAIWSCERCIVLRCIPDQGMDTSLVEQEEP